MQECVAREAGLQYEHLVEHIGILAPAYDITYSPEGTKGEHATSVRYSGNPNLEDIISAGTGIRISRKRCIEIINEIESVCNAELDIDKTVKIK